MQVLSKVLIGLVAVIHAYIAWFEIFAWQTKGPEIFGTIPVDLFPRTVEIAANQGLYNAFLSGGLIWSLCIRDRLWRRNVAMYFLICVAIAGLFGAATVTPKTLVVQTLPAALALIALMVAARQAPADPA